MTTEEITRIMFESCDKHTSSAWHNDFWTITQEELERFAKAIAAKEREACAEIAESYVSEEFVQMKDTANSITQSIRARCQQ